MFSAATWLYPTHSAQLTPLKYWHPPVSIAFLPHSCICTTSIISIMDAICPGYHRTLSESLRQSQNIIRNITDIFMHFYHLNHASTLRRFQYCTFYSRLYYYSIVALFSCNIKGPIPCSYSSVCNQLRSLWISSLCLLLISIFSYLS